MKTRRFDFNWIPLQAQISISVDGTTPDRQDYDANTDTYTPDYRIVPLVLQPIVSIIDKNEIIPSGKVNYQLANVKWTENINGTKKLITTGSEYDVTTSGENAGRIKMKKNVKPKLPVTLEFYAEYPDIRTGQIIVIRGSYMVSCSSSASQLRIELDKNRQMIYDPLVENPTRNLEYSFLVYATLYSGEKKISLASTKTLFVWEKQREDGTWSEIGSDTLMDYDVGYTTVPIKFGVKIYAERIGESLTLRCRCKYSPEGNASSVVLTDASPSATITITRRICKFDTDITELPYNIPADCTGVFPKGVVRTSNNIINDYSQVLIPLWYIAKNKNTGTLDYNLVAHGITPEISTDVFDKNIGAVIGFEAVDRGASGAWVDSADDSTIVDETGAVILIK